jgi:hypothetical protein
MAGASRRGGQYPQGSSASTGYGNGYNVNGGNANTNNHNPAPSPAPGVYPQNSISGYGSQVRWAAAPASAPQRPGMMPFQQSFGHNRQGLISRPALQFKPSPFYRVEQLIGNVRTLESTLTSFAPRVWIHYCRIATLAQLLARSNAILPSWQMSTQQRTLYAIR